MELLERETQFDQLAAAFDGVAGGSGRNVLVLGEAGAGKTSLVRSLIERRSGRADLFWGACEALFSPRPLGPIADFAPALPPALAAQVYAGQNYNGLFPAFLAFLRDRPRPAVVVVEDAHWADEATLDFIKYLGRRIDGTRALLIVTLRDDELALDHPLRRVLGDLQGTNTSRIALPPLSPAAVAHLARAAGRDGSALFRLTGGNPFYVGEVLASSDQHVPASVRDAVLARFSRLGATAQRVVELVAMEPGRLERAAIDASLPGSDAAVAEACARGVLRADAACVAFRHEIARRCVEHELPPARRAQLHARLLEFLRQRGDVERGLAREVHHALGAGRKEEVVPLARRAAELAASVGSHREATTLYRRALEAGDGADDAARAALLEAAALELQHTGQLQEAIDLRMQALVLRRAAGDRLAEGASLCRLGPLHRHLNGNMEHYASFTQAAIDVLEPLGPSSELAMAYASRSHILNHQSQFEAAIDWGQRAVAMAQPSGDTAAVALALGRLATARLATSDNAEARAQVEHALALALDARSDSLAAEMYTNLQTAVAIHRDLAYALDVGQRGLAFCEARDLDGAALLLRSRCAYLQLDLGRWDAAGREFVACAVAPTASAYTRAGCEHALRVLQVRRGTRPQAALELGALDGDVDDYWRNASTHLRTLRVGYRPASLATTCAEAAWLRGDTAAAIDVALRGLDEARTTNDTLVAGPLLVWLVRLGVAPPPFDGELVRPSALELAGDRAAAAAEWERLNEPYEQALALAFGDAEQMRLALPRFEVLGAARAAAATRARLRALGVRGIERGPYGHARNDTFGFTRREKEIAGLLQQGLSNAAIAQRLHRSERTVETHVAGVLAKLGVNSRTQAMLKLTGENKVKRAG